VLFRSNHTQLNMADKDVVMGDADKQKQDAQKADPTKKEEKKPEPKDPRDAVILDLQNSIELIEKAVSTKEIRFVNRALRLLPAIRKNLSRQILTHAFTQCLPEDHTSRTHLVQLFGSQDDVDMTNDTFTLQPLPKNSGNLPEVEVFLHLLAVVHLIDLKQLDKAEASGGVLLKRVQTLNRRMLDPLAAKAWFFYCRPFELSQRFIEVRGAMIAAHRTATLHHHDNTQSMLIVMLLRNYLHCNQYDLADKLVNKAPFPENTSNYLYARYHYYLGRIRSVQLDYTEAYSCLMQAIRKAPQSAALGFRAEVYKVLCVVQLLMGEIPSRDIFYQNGLRAALAPYLRITQAVRLGNISLFEKEMKTHQLAFQKDKTYNLIVRLRRDVIKTALRNISVAYSRISLQDVCTRLQLSNVVDAEYMVAKAIADGVIEGRINHETGCLVSRDNADIYSTREPQIAFHKRIEFCLKIRNEAVKAMRYPEDAHKGDMETAEQRRERLAAEAEFAKELADEDDDDMMGDF